MTIWTAYQGIEVVESDPDVKYRHPRREADAGLAPLKGATLLALADGVFLVVCDVEGCSFNGITGRDPYVKPEGEYKSIVDQAGSLFSHMNGTHRKVDNRPKTYSRYDEARIKVAIKIWLKWRATKISNWTQSACDELERLGFEPWHAKKWTPDQLGSLVRKYMQRDQFKSIKAGPMDSADQEALASMVREAAAREGAKGGRTVAANVRITEPKSPPHKHTPIDFEKIISETKAAQQATQEQQEKEEVVVVSPSLSFVVGGGDAFQLPPAEVVNTVKEAPQRQAEPVTSESRFKHVADLPDGSPMFTYNGVLMVGKPVRDVQI